METKTKDEEASAVKQLLDNKPWDGVERRSGKERRQFAYLQGHDKRRIKDRRKNPTSTSFNLPIPIITTP